MKEQVMPAAPFTRLLVATGGSPWSERALMLAMQLAHLIIIGSRGVSRVTLGETGNEVLLKAPIPVMVVK